MLNILNKHDDKKYENDNRFYQEQINNYNDKILSLINKIREDPTSYADIIEDSIKYMIEEQDINNKNKRKFIFKRKIKVALNRGEPAFHEAAEFLRNMNSLPPLEFNNNICIPLPENIDEINDPSYLKEQVKILRQSTNIDVYYKDLIKIPEISVLFMIVDDTEKNPGKRRKTLLSKEFKYIGINSKFIGKNFIAYFSFSR